MSNLFKSKFRLSIFENPGPVTRCNYCVLGVGGNSIKKSLIVVLYTLRGGRFGNRGDDGDTKSGKYDLSPNTSNYKLMNVIRAFG